MRKTFPCGPLLVWLTQGAVAFAADPLQSEVHTIAASTRVCQTAGPADSAIKPGRHIIREFGLPVPDSAPGVIDVAPDGKIWFVMGGGGFAGLQYKSLSYVARIDSDTALTVVKLPTAEALPSGIKLQRDGRAYITEYGGNKIAIIDMANSTVSEFPIQTAASSPTALDFDKHGRLWFNLNKAHLLACLNADGKIVELPIPTRDSRPTGLVVDDRDNVWFAEMYGNKIGMFAPTGYFTEFNLRDPNSKPTAMLFDPATGIWFSERGSSKIGNIKDGKLRELNLPGAYAGPFFITKGPDNAIWFTELYTGKIGRFDLKDEVVSEYDLGFEEMWPGSLLFDQKGNLWVTMLKGNRIVRIENQNRDTL